jgi:uncharacterized protein Yka (UPF0111/DUF47 family)
MLVFEFQLERKSDNVYDKAVLDLFENETDAKNIIKYKEVLSVLKLQRINVKV